MRADDRSHSCKARGDLTLRGEELRKDHDSAFRTRQRRKHPEFLFETRDAPTPSLQRLAKAASGKDVIAWRQAGGLLPIA
jgi:hypothetical protein